MSVSSSITFNKVIERAQDALDTDNDAIKAIEILKAAPDQAADVESHRFFWLGVSYHKLEDYDRSRSHLKEAQGLFPCNMEIAYYLADCALSQGNFEEAERILNEEFKSNWDAQKDYDNLILMAAVLVNQEKYKEAEPYALKAARYNDQEDVQYKELLCEIYDNLDDRELALKFATSCAMSLDAKEDIDDYEREMKKRMVDFIKKHGPLEISGPQQEPSP